MHPEVFLRSSNKAEQQGLTAVADIALCDELTKLIMERTPVSGAARFVLRFGVVFTPVVLELTKCDCWNCAAQAKLSSEPITIEHWVHFQPADIFSRGDGELDSLIREGLAQHILPPESYEVRCAGMRKGDLERDLTGGKGRKGHWVVRHDLGFAGAGKREAPPWESPQPKVLRQMQQIEKRDLGRFCTEAVVAEVPMIYFDYEANGGTQRYGGDLEQWGDLEVMHYTQQVEDILQRLTSSEPEPCSCC